MAMISPLNKNKLLEHKDNVNIFCGDAIEDSEYIDFDFNEMGDANYFLQLADKDWELELNDDPDVEPDKMICEDCSVNLEPMENSYRCPNCGIDKKSYEETDDYSISVANNYNTNECSSMAIRVTGEGSYRYHRGLQRNNSDYSKTQTKKTIRQFNQCNARAHKKFPVIILKEAAEMYNILQKKKIVRRGNGKDGSLGGCLYFAFIENRITKKSKTIANFMGVEDSYISKGIAHLRELHDQGIINLPLDRDPKEDYIYQYFEGLKIDNKYKEVVSQVIDRSEETDLMGDNNSRISTKCSGAIYLLQQQLDLPFTKSDIVNVCEISKSTYIQYYKYLFINRKLINIILKKHNIPRMRSKKNAKKVKKTKNKCL